jgi:hypothetical protein
VVKWVAAKHSGTGSLTLLAVLAAAAGLTRQRRIETGISADDASAGCRRGAAKPTTGYAPVNGLKMYYEVHGSGDPVVLLHGAFTSLRCFAGTPWVHALYSPSEFEVCILTLIYIDDILYR